MIDLVRKKHDGDGWIVFQELANSVGWSAKRWADAVALGVWVSNKYEVHLYEFKESREDLKKELRDPTKAEGVGKFCHYWWLCVRDVKLLEGLAIPAVWGIVTPTKRGGSEILKVVRKAPKLKPQPFTPGFCVAAIRNIRKGFVDPANAVTNASVTTFCRGRWPAEDRVEISESPPHHERCDECSRQMLEVRRVERGLDEFRDAWSETFVHSGEGG